MTGPRFILVTPLAGGRLMLDAHRIVQAETVSDHPGCRILYRDNEMYSDLPSCIDVLQSLTDLYALVNGYQLGALGMGGADDEA